MFNFNKDIVCSDNVILAKRKKNRKKLAEYKLQKIDKPFFVSDTLAHSIGYSGVPVTMKQIYAAVKRYNEYIDFLESLPGFISVFIENDLSITKEQALSLWSEETVKNIFSLKEFYFDAPLLNNNNEILYDWHFVHSYSVSIGGEEIDVPIGEPLFDYPTKVIGKECIWNLFNNGHDFTVFLWMLFGERCWKNEEDADDDDQVSYSHLTCYEAAVYDFDVEIQFIKIFKKLENLGYLESYTI